MKTIALYLMTTFAEPELDTATKLKLAQALVEALATRLEQIEVTRRHEEAGKAYEAAMKAAVEKAGRPGCALGRQQEIICPPKNEEKKQ